MRTFLSDWRLVRRACGVVGLMVSISAGQSSAADLSGDYADGGTIVSADVGVPAVEPSLNALLNLRFEAAAVSGFRDQSSHVTIKHEGGVLEIEARDRENQVMWQRRWHEGSGYVQRDERVLLRFRAEGSAGDEIVLTLEAVAPHGLLQLTAQRLTPTLLGPTARPLGTFMFHRMP